MDIRSILVNVDLDTAGSTSLNYAIDLAQSFDAELIGLAADIPNMSFIGADIGNAAADFYAMQSTEIERRLLAAEKQFRATVPAGLRHEWRAFIGDPVRCLLDAARRADIIVTGSTASPTYQERRRIDLGELVIGAGRPVLDVAKDASKVSTANIVIAWKNTREARRAVADALPFLKLAKEVTAITVSEDAEGEQASLDDLVAWLAGHGVAAKAELIVNKDGVGGVLEKNASFRQADMLVLGGYGHTRLREWLFGGMTRNMLKAETVTRLFSN